MVVYACVQPGRQRWLLLLAGMRLANDQAPLASVDLFFFKGASAAFQARVSVIRWCVMRTRGCVECLFSVCVRLCWSDTRQKSGIQIRARVGG